MSVSASVSRATALRIATIVVTVAAWELFVAFAGSSLLPSLRNVIAAFVDLVRTRELLSDAVFSVRRVAFGYGIGSVIGVFAGIATGRLLVFRETVGAMLQFLRPIPAIAMIPYALLAFGLTEQSKIFLIVWGTVFPVWVNTHLGVQRVDRDLIWSARTLGATDRQVFMRVVLPASSGQIIAGLRVGLSTAFLCLVAAELTGASEGLGFRIEQAHVIFRPDRMVAATIALALFGVMADQLFTRVVRRVAPWYHDASRWQA
jgi:ABC-type nitrate/sulfonate/bicarbonate transport system permease component